SCAPGLYPAPEREQGGVGLGAGTAGCADSSARRARAEEEVLMTLTGTGSHGFPRVPEQHDLRTRRALRRFPAGLVPLDASILTGMYASLPPAGQQGRVFF